LLRWLFFNLCTGNGDSHAKNLSLIATPGGLRLAPFYDLMCTRVYPGPGAHFAFAIAGDTEPGKLTRAHIADLARTLGVAPRYLQQLALEMARLAPPAMAGVVQGLAPMLEPQARIMAERLVQRIGSLSNAIARRIA
jgi:serine/threonine-protein kinase HipA